MVDEERGKERGGGNLPHVRQLTFPLFSPNSVDSVESVLRLELSGNWASLKRRTGEHGETSHVKGKRSHFPRLLPARVQDGEN